MGRIEKGKISSIEDSGNKAEVIPSSSSQTVSIALVVPESLKTHLAVNSSVIYVVFDDNTGIILGRMDGKYM